MNTLGSVLLLVGVTAVSVGLWFVLEQRYGLRTGLRERFPVTEKNPWLLTGILLAVLLLMGIFFLAVRAPLAVYCGVGGALIGTVVSLLPDRKE